MTRLNRSAGGMRRHAWVAATLVLLGCGGGGDDGNGSGTQPPTGGTTPPAGAWGCDQDSGWCWAGALARGYPLRDVWVAPSGQAWAVGDAGLVFHFDGSAWRYDTTIADADGVSHLLLAISGTSEQDLWAIDRDRVYHFDGKGWTQVLANGDIVDFDYIADIHAVSPDSVVTVGGSGALLRWDGASWTADEVPAMFDLHTVWGSNPQDYWAGGTDGFESAVLRFDGSTWSEVDTTHLGDSGTQHIVEDVTAMWGAEGGHLWAGGPGGVYHFDGSIWEQSFDAGAVVGGWASGPAGVGAGGGDALSNGVIRFDGSSWTTEQPLDTEAVTALGGGPDGVVHSIGAQGGIARSDGAGWEIEALAFQDELRGAWVADGGTVWTAAASGGGLMARSSDGWSWRKRDATTDFRSVFGFADDRIWLAGQVAGSVPPRGRPLFFLFGGGGGGGFWGGGGGGGGAPPPRPCGTGPAGMSSSRAARTRSGTSTARMPSTFGRWAATAARERSRSSTALGAPPSPPRASTVYGRSHPTTCGP